MDDNDVLDAADAALEVFFEGGREPVERTVEPAEGPTEDTPELTIDAQGRLHGPDGKFIPTSETPGAEAASTQSEESPEGDDGGTGVSEPEEQTDEESGDLVLDVDDPDVLEFLDKYDGDLVAALKAATEAQSLIGRQGQELGSARKELEELQALRAQMEDLQRSIQLQSAASQYNWDELIEENPEQAASLAVELRNPVLLERAVEAWGEENPFQAMMFMNRLSMAAAEEAEGQEEEPADFSGEMDTLKQRYPDLPESLPEIQRLAETRPALARLLQDEDPRTRVAALEDLYLLSRSQRESSDTSTRARQIVLRAKAEADAAKADAAVLSASNTSPVQSEAVAPNDLLERALREALDDDEFVIV